WSPSVSVMPTRLSKEKSKHWAQLPGGNPGTVVNVYLKFTTVVPVILPVAVPTCDPIAPPSGWSGGFGGVILKVITLSCWMNRGFASPAADGPAPTLNITTATPSAHLDQAFILCTRSSLQGFRMPAVTWH